MGKKSSPKPPDYAAAAAEQAQASKEVTEQQSWANRPDQFTPFGSQTWANQMFWDPATKQNINRWTQTTKLNQQSQDALDSQMAIGKGRSDVAKGLLGRVQDDYGRIVNWNNFAPKGQGLTLNQYTPEQIQRSVDFSGASAMPEVGRVRDRAEQAMYERGAARLDPQYAEQEDAMRTRLLNQGFQAGDAGFEREMRKFNERKSDDYANLRRDAIAMGGDEAARQFGMGLQGRQQGIQELMNQAQFGNTAAQQVLAQQMGLGAARFGEQQQASAYQNQLRQQDIAETLQQRGWTLNEINAILSGQQIGMPSMPGFQNANRAEGLQALSAADMQWGADMDRSNFDQAALQGLMSGVGSIAGPMMMASDRRLKQKIQRIGTLLSGLPLYAFEYIWGEKGVGVMAQECLEVFPEAVYEHSSGYLMVNYGVIE